MGSLANPAILDQPTTPADGLAELTDLLSLRAGLAIIHHVPGRLRLRIGQPVLDWAAGRGLDAAGAAAWLAGLAAGRATGVAVGLPGLIGLRLNPVAASLVIDYDPRRLPSHWWETLMQGDPAAVAALVRGGPDGDPDGGSTSPTQSGEQNVR